MFAYIKGKLAYKEASMAIIEANGVGYQINIPLSTYTTLGTQEDCQLFTYLQVREDAHVLFGFATMLEKSVFLDLISISGVGPSTALAALSSLSSSEIKHAIATEDVKKVQTIKGVGGKTAQRLVLELKDKYQKEGPIIEGEKSYSSNNRTKEEALTALVTLGMVKSSAEKTLDAIIKTKGSDIDLETLIKLALKSA
jgi:holliday junction DNA helicase RuvA